jgi:hypothetical protein
MTAHLDELLRDFGYLAALAQSLSGARDEWAPESSNNTPPPNQIKLPDAFGKAFNDGATRKRQETSEFLYGMCFVHAHGLFEHYLKSILW